MTRFFVVTSVGESAIGVLLLLAPAMVLAFLFGPRASELLTPVIGRVVGVALIGLGVASWRVRSETGARTQLGWLTGILIYNVLAAVGLVVAGMVLKMLGPFLWPAVLYHVVLAAWGVDCLRRRPPRSLREEPSA